MHSNQREKEEASPPNPIIGWLASSFSLAGNQLLQEQLP
jgi:hypothetical protein